MQNNIITPIVLEQDADEIRRKAELAKTFAATFHVDLIDGFYADNVTVAPADLQGLDFSSLAVDFHLLVDDPVEWLPECVAFSPARIIAQVEHMGNVEHYLAALHGYGSVGGIGIGIHTPIAEITDAALSQTDVVILMAIEAGYSGKPFLPEVLPKIVELRKRYNGAIVIDGGVNPEHAASCFAAGASEIGANSYIWKGAGTPEEHYRKLLKTVGGTDKKS